MPENIEIKARVPDERTLKTMLRAALSLATAPASELQQTDTFFHTAHGRLKLREQGEGPGALIAYFREDAAGPKSSQYSVVPCEHPAELRNALACTLGVRGVVRKSRTVVLIDNTRVHLDTVSGLGHFVELEVELAPAIAALEGEAVAQSLMMQLGIRPDQLVAGAYIDLLEGAHDAQGTASYPR